MRPFYLSRAQVQNDIIFSRFTRYIELVPCRLTILPRAPPHSICYTVYDEDRNGTTQMFTIPFIVMEQT